MTVPTGLVFSDPQIKPLSTAGKPQPGAYLLFYLTGTATPADVYADGLLTTPLSQTPGASQPSCTADSAGRFNQIYLDPATVYRVQLYSSVGVLLEDTDPYVLPTSFAPTQADIGKLLYPQTAAEQAASVTPVNLFIPPGNVLRYGNNTVPGTTSMLAAIQAAVNQAYQTAPGAAPVYLPYMIYRVDGAITATINEPLKIHGDGQALSVIYQHTDADVFGITAADSSNGRLIVQDLSFVAKVGTPMATGAAIRFMGGTTIPPVRTLDIRRVSFQGSATTNEFKYGIWMSSANQATIDTSIFYGVVGSSSSEHIHVQSDHPYSIGANCNNISTFSAAYGVRLVNNSSSGIEGFTLSNSECADVFFGFAAANKVGIRPYVEPLISIVNTHIDSVADCISISNFNQILISNVNCYRNGSLNNAPFIHLTAVSQFKIDGIFETNNLTDCPVVLLDGTTNAVQHGIIDGVYSGNGSTSYPVVAAVSGSVLSDILVRGIIRFGYTNFLPALGTGTYKPGGGLLLDLPACNPLSNDEIDPSITPTGSSPTLQLDLTYCQGNFVTVSASSGTISRILGGRPGQRVTLYCSAGGVTLANNASQLMPGASNFTFSAGQTIDLYRLAAKWQAVGRQ
jgi:hypothetical protein